MTINEKLISHIKDNGQFVEKEDVNEKRIFEKNGKFHHDSPLDNQGYISAFINGQQPQEKKKISSSMYTICIPLEDLYSLKRFIVTMGYSYLIISAGNVSYSPLYFHDGGIQEFFNNIKNYITLTKDKDDSHLFYCSNICEPLEKSLSSLDFTEYFEDVYKNKKDYSWQLLEWGAKVTQSAKNFIGKRFEEEEIYEDKKDKKEDDEFEIIKSKDDEIPETKFDENLETELLQTILEKKESILDEKTWKSYFDEKGKIKDVEKLKNQIFYGGVDDKIRKDVWKFLLGYYPFNSTAEEREMIRREKKVEYELLKNQWKSISQKQESRFASFRDLKTRVEKDVTRTDRQHPDFKDDDSPNLVILNDILITYGFYNFDLGYCQGMGDLLSPIIVTQRDEVDSFWCFANLMEKMEQNFFINSQGMENQLTQLRNLFQTMDKEFYNYFVENDAQNLYFCFRWILVLFKREFEFEDVKSLWEKVWTELKGPNFHLFICFAIMREQRDKIMKGKLRFDEILKLCIDLSYNLNLKQVLIEAETQFLLYEKMEKDLKNKK